MNKFTFITVVCMGSLLIQVGSADAQSRRRAASRINCPKVVANLKEGAFYARSNDKRRFPFACFETTRNAKKAGYTKLVEVASRDYSGWWRIPFKLHSTTCGSTLTGTANMFMQVKESDQGLFAQVCPGDYRYTGSKSSTGFVVSLVRSITENKATSPCSDGKKEITDIIQFENISGLKAETITFQKLERCTAADSSFSCVTEYRGEALRESSNLFPPAPGSINTLPHSCGQLLQNCFDAGCHGG